eukprot:791116-Prymnesium_polylepis.2
MRRSTQNSAACMAASNKHGMHRCILPSHGMRSSASGASTSMLIAHAYASRPRASGEFGGECKVNGAQSRWPPHPARPSVRDSAPVHEDSLCSQPQRCPTLHKRPASSSPVNAEYAGIERQQGAPQQHHAQVAIGAVIHHLAPAMERRHLSVKRQRRGPERATSDAEQEEDGSRSRQQEEQALQRSAAPVEPHAMQRVAVRCVRGRLD